MMVKKIHFLIFFLLFVVFSTKLSAQSKLMFGGGVSFHMPSGYFNSERFTFKDAAASGYGINASSLWFYNPRLSIGTELGYTLFPKNKKTWNTTNYGAVKVNYQSFNFSAIGSYYFSDEEIRPYISSIFGIYFLRNMVDFSSNYIGTTNDASVRYVATSFHASFGAESGVLFEINKRTMFQVGIRYTLVPRIEPIYYPETQHTINPHGKQNQWGLYTKLFFSGR